MPQNVALRLGQVAVGGVDGEVQLGGLTYKEVLPLAHLLAPPAHHRVVKHGTRFVGHNHVFVYTHHGSITLTGGTGTIGVVETEEVGVGLLEGNAVGLKTVGETLLNGVSVYLAMHYAAPATLKKSCLHRLGDAGMLVIVIGMHLYAVHQQERLFLLGSRRQPVLYADNGALHGYAHKSLLMQHLQLRSEWVLLAEG